MILKCINTGGYHLTLNKVYNAELYNMFNFEGKKVFDYYIINDIGIRHGVKSSLFMNISEHRYEILKQLGI
jgi:hypothetical protein